MCLANLQLFMVVILIYRALQNIYVTKKDKKLELDRVQSNTDIRWENIDVLTPGGPNY